VLYNNGVNCQLSVYIASVINGWMSMEHWHSNSDSGTLKNSETDLCQCHLTHMYWPGTESGHPWWRACE
jgi:hypothetical protein